MNKHEFLVVLRERLSGLPEEDIKRSLDYYSEIIDDRIEDGLTEETSVEAVGTIDEIVSQIFTEISLPKLVKVKAKTGRALKMWEVILLILGSPVWLPLLAAAVIIILSVYIVLWAVILVLYAVVISFAAGGVAGVLGSLAFIPIGDLAQGMLFFGFGLVCAGITVLLFFGFNQITKGVVNLSKMILLGIKACFVGKGEIQ